MGSGYPKQLVSNMSNKIHQSSISYLNQTISWKKLIGFEPMGLFESLT